MADAKLYSNLYGHATLLPTPRPAHDIMITPYLPGMLKLLTTRHGSGGGTSKREDALKDGVNATSFAQQGQRNRIKCFRCGQRGHVVKKCPHRTYTRNEDDLSKEIAADASAQRKLDKDFASWSG